MNNFVWFYIEANIVCIIISCILLFRELKNVDKQLRNIEFIKTISIYIILYLFDILRGVVDAGIIKSSSFINNYIYFFIFVTFTYGSCQWFVYSEVSQGNTEIYKIKNRIKWMAPIIILCLLFLIYTIVISIIDTGSVKSHYIIFVHLLIIFTAFVYELFSSIRSLNRARKNNETISCGFYLFMGISPIIFSSFIVFQFIFPDIPIFCFLNTIFMLCFYFNGLDKIISIDSLTKLNNRNQLNKYFHQIKRENEYSNYVLVIDIDNFKSINDKYGHLEGDNALVLVADTFRCVCGMYSYKIFISRYGGDEFVIIVQAPDKDKVEQIKKAINEKVSDNAIKSGKPYNLSVSIGISMIKEEHLRLEQSLEMADKEMYLEKSEKASIKLKSR